MSTDKKVHTPRKNMDRKNKGIIISVCIMLFVLFIIFAIYAGTSIGTDIGEFIYNIKH